MVFHSWSLTTVVRLPEGRTQSGGQLALIRSALCRGTLISLHFRPLSYMRPQRCSLLLLHESVAMSDTCHNMCTLWVDHASDVGKAHLPARNLVCVRGRGVDDGRVGTVINLSATEGGDFIRQMAIWIYLI